MSSLLEQASVIITPNGVKAGKLYGLKGTDLDVVRATTATRVNSAGLIETVANNVPRLDYTSGSCPSILVEGQRTNLLTYSEQFDNGVYTKINANITANSSVSPKGDTTADSLIENTLNDDHYIDVRPTVTNANHSVSIYVKANGRTKFQLREGTNGDVSTFDLNNPSGNIKSVGNGWFRVVLTTTPASTTFIFQLRLLDNSGNLVYTGNGTSGLFIWGAQLEVGSYPTSYIPTVASAVTRNASVISKTGIADLIGQSEGTMFCDINYIKNDGGTYLSIEDWENFELIRLYTVGGAENITVQIYNDANIYLAPLFTPTIGQRYKIAFSYSLTGCSFYINGNLIDSNTSSLNIPTCSNVRIGSFTSGQEMNSLVNSVQLFKTRLTNAQLATLTTL